MPLATYASKQIEPPCKVDSVVAPPIDETVDQCLETVQSPCDMADTLRYEIAARELLLSNPVLAAAIATRGNAGSILALIDPTSAGGSM